MSCRHLIFPTRTGKIFHFKVSSSSLNVYFPKLVGNEGHRAEAITNNGYVANSSRRLAPEERTRTHVQNELFRHAEHGADAHSRVHRHRRQSTGTGLPAHAWERAATHGHAPTDISDSRLQPCVRMHLSTTSRTEGLLTSPRPGRSPRRPPLTRSSRDHGAAPLNANEAAQVPAPAPADCVKTSAGPF